MLSFTYFFRIGDNLIPEGAEVVMNIWEMHRHKKNWKFNANEFNPDNFLKENEIERHKYSYLPFSAGPRICIGKKLTQHKAFIYFNFLF